MGRDWVNITFKFDRNDTVSEASATPRTNEEVLEEFITDEWGEDFIPPVKNADLMFGGIREGKIKRYIEKVFSECAFIEKAGVVSVSDSAHAGTGWVFERDGPTSIIEVDKYSGYEGARGSDVAGDIYDDHRIKVDELWHWD